MYCSSCATQIKPGLNYCNRCGTRVSRTDSDTQKSVAENLSASLSYIGAFGLIGFIFVALVLVKNGVDNYTLGAISFFYLSALFGICYLILRQIDVSSAKSAASAPDFRNNFQTGELNPANTARLESAPAPAAVSVTDNTTKTIDEVLLKRN
jgi:hypothetical protein